MMEDEVLRIHEKVMAKRVWQLDWLPSFGRYASLCGTDHLDFEFSWIDYIILRNTYAQCGFAVLTVE